MTDRELMQQALEALEEINKLSIGENAIALPAEIDTAMDALRERLAQPEQEPVIRPCKVGGACVPTESGPCACRQLPPPPSPVAAQPEQEPVLETVYETIIHWDEGGGKRSRRELARRIVALYTAPPQRKPLTDEELNQIYAEPQTHAGQYARAIEAKLKEKNT